MVLIRTANLNDWPAIWQIFQAVVSKGDTYAYAPDMSEAEAQALWLTPLAHTYVAETTDGIIVGTYVLKPNQPSLGSHVANAGFMVDSQCRGSGIGRELGEHALVEAKRLGYLAMQFNFVVSTNEGAVALWKSLGFTIIGTIPQAFRHSSKGLVDIYIMHRFL
jgi:L-amino acid N-acyltransferase YncA